MIGARPLSHREFLHPIPTLTYELVFIVDFYILEVRSKGHVSIAGFEYEFKSQSGECVQKNDYRVEDTVLFSRGQNRRH